LKPEVTGRHQRKEKKGGRAAERGRLTASPIGVRGGVGLFPANKERGKWEFLGAEFKPYHYSAPGKKDGSSRREELIPDKWKTSLTFFREEIVV